MKFTPGALFDGRKEVALAGTPERLSTLTDEICSVVLLGRRVTLIRFGSTWKLRTTWWQG
jgi:hypothetical protein